MRRLVVLALVGSLAFTFVASPASRAAMVASSWSVGAAPFGLALDSPTGKVYVANSASSVYDINHPSAPARGLVSVVDPATGSVGRILTSLTSNFVLVDSASRRLYSSNATYSASQESTDVFDLESGAQIASISGVGGLMPSLDAPAGRLFVGGHVLTAVDTSTNTVVMSMNAPAGAWFGTAVDPQLHRLYLTDASSTNPRLFVFDDRDLSSVGQVALGTAVRYAIAVDQARHLVFIAGTDPSNASAATFYVIDADSLAVVHTTAMQGFPLGIALAPARGRVYVSTAGSAPGVGSIYGIDAASFEVAETMRISQFRPGWPLMHPDGRLYVGNYNDRGDPAQNPPQDSTLLAIDLTNHAPVFQSLTISPSTAFTRDTLSADASATDPDFSPSLAGDPVTYTYEWSRNGTPLPGATAPTLDLAVPGNGDRGDTISVAVTATDPQGASSSKTASLVVVNAPPLVAAHLNTTSPHTNDVLTVSSEVSDADGDPVTVHYDWLRNGSVVPGATSNTFDLAIVGDHGDTITARVTAADDHGGVSVANLDAVVMDSAPTVALALNTQSPRTNDVLTATATGFDLDGDTLVYDFEFWLNGAYVSSGVFASNVSSWNLANPPYGNRGDTITMYVSAWDGAMWSQRTNVTAVIVNSPPDVTVSLDNKTPNSKAVLTATAVGSDADGDSMTFTYAWQVNRKVKQTTTTTATTSSFDLAGRVSNGDVVTVIVTANDGYVSSTTATDGAMVTNNPRR